MQESTVTQKTNHRVAGICIVFLVLFAAISWSASQTKNATIDEPVHSLSGWNALRRFDFRLEPEAAALWQFWAALPNLGVDLNAQFIGGVWNDLSFDSQGAVNWTAHTLYETPGNDGEAFVRRSRAMMMVPAVLLGAMIGWWSFKLAGPIAAIIAVGFFSFDPNFLAHAPIVKADVSLSLLMTGLGYAVWRLGQRASLLRVIGIGLLVGTGINTKFSGLIFLPILAALFLVRALLPLQMIVTRGCLQNFRSRFVALLVIGVTATAIAVFVTWATYGFRFRPAPPRDARMNMSAIHQRAMELETAVATAPRDPTAAEIQNQTPSLITRAVEFADKHRLFPQAMLGGLLYQHACLQVWPGYLMGRLYGIGPWYYFPLAICFKTPLATLFAIALSLGIFFCLIFFMVRARSFSTEILWATACVFIPFCIFAIAAIHSNINIGLRSVLPIYPFLFIAIGVAGSQAIRFSRRLATTTALGLFVFLLIETLPAWPDYIPFFNFAAGGKAGGFALLGDSNLDWGQDLKPLVAWHQDHPEVPIYLHYFGMVNPNFFTTEFHHFSVFDKGKTFNADVPLKPGVLAVSTNYLQGLYDTPDDIDFFRKLGRRHPDQIVGGSIYLYKYPLR